MMKPNTSATDYHAEGYCLFRDILDPGEVRELNAELEDLVLSLIHI